MATRPAPAAYEDRGERRDEILHRTQVRDADGAAHHVMLVNVSPHGFMARCDTDFAAGERVSIDLPVVGTFDAEVRWSLGGRIGCRLHREVPPALYQFALTAMR